MSIDFSEELDMIVNGLLAEVEKGVMNPSEASTLAIQSIQSDNNSEELLVILDQRAEYIGIETSAPPEEKFPWSVGEQDVQSGLRETYLGQEQDYLRELIRWAVIAKKIVIENQETESLGDRIKNQILGAYTSQIVREATVLGESFGVDFSRDTIIETVRKMASEGELTRLPGGKHVPNMYAVTQRGGEDDIVITGWPVKILMEKYPDLNLSDNGALTIPSAINEIPKISVEAYISSNCVERAISSDSSEFLHRILSTDEFNDTTNELPDAGRLYPGPLHQKSKRLIALNLLERDHYYGYKFNETMYFFVKPEYSHEGSEPPEIWYKGDNGWRRKLVSESAVKWAFAAFEKTMPKAKVPNMKWTDSRTKLEMLHRKGMEETIYRQFLKWYCWV
jgi:hypothetical protein